MAPILVKAYIRQLFGSPEIHLFEFDSQSASIAELRELVSGFVDDRTVTLTWLDQDGDEIRLSTDEQLAFAVKHGLKDNVLRVSVRVDWLRLAGDCRREQPKSSTAAIDGEEADVVAEDNGGNDMATNEGGTAEEEDEEEASARAPAAKRKGGRPAGDACYSGFVRTVGPDGVARERDLTEEEAAYLLRRSSPLRDLTHSPFAITGGFSAPHLSYHGGGHFPLQPPRLLHW